MELSPKTRRNLSVVTSVIGLSAITGCTIESEPPTNTPSNKTQNTSSDHNIPSGSAIKNLEFYPDGSVTYRVKDFAKGDTGDFLEFKELCTDVGGDKITIMRVAASYQWEAVRSPAVSVSHPDCKDGKITPSDFS